MKDFVYPLGSVVLAKGPDDKVVKVMISAYGISDKKNNKSYEYAGFELPGGFDPNKICFLNNDNIICPIFVGYINDENNAVRKEVSKHYDSQEILFLPVGSIVEIADGKKVMITGMCMLDIADDKLFDYVGEDLNNRLIYKFNKEDIKEIIFVGFSDEKHIAYRTFLEDARKNVKDKKNIYSAIKDFMLKDGD